jgi:hypothetical protein
MFLSPISFVNTSKIEWNVATVKHYPDSGTSQPPPTNFPRLRIVGHSKQMELKTLGSFTSNKFKSIPFHNEGKFGQERGVFT